uniref:Orphan G-protein coupled receptor 62 n=1 Tax=Platynereis dumerilii TaxID=6359 RepID=A0A0K0PUL3_PLADU|nr:orphan G-protein coupled receptor 62 [Platynereis dumerilii]
MTSEGVSPSLFGSGGHYGQRLGSNDQFPYYALPQHGTPSNATFRGMLSSANVSVNLQNETMITPPNGSGAMTPEEIKAILDSHIVLTSNFAPFTQIMLIVAFSILIAFGALGNGLVCFVVARNSSMRTPRNIFIINLAISDLTLCLFTQPFNLLKVSMSMWSLGGFMCKFVPMFAGTNVFVSTISITAIALDRFQVIVYPTRDSMKRVGAAVALLAIWLISLLMASPLLIFNVLNPVEIAPGIVLYYVCVENPASHYEKGAYSIASMIFQYIVPILIVTVAHARICNKLKYRMINQQPTVALNSPFQKHKNEREAKRKRKTNTLLVTIAAVFVCSWMPLNVFDIMADFNHSYLKTIDKNGLVFPICHLLVLSSACTNPLLYGWLNENFRREFVSVLCSPCCKSIRKLLGCHSCCATKSDRQGTGGYKKANNGTNNHLEVENTFELRSTQVYNTKNTVI